MPIIGSGGETAMSYIQSTIGDNGPTLSKYYKTPNGATPAAYTAVSTSGTIAYSMFRGAVTTTPTTTAGNVGFGWRDTYIAFSPSSGTAVGQQIIGAPGSSSSNYSAKQTQDYFGQTPPNGYGPVGFFQPFTIPQYTDICFKITGAGACSGESIWDPSAVIPNACVASGIDGLAGQASFLLPPNGTCDGSASAMSGSVKAYGTPVTNGTEVVFAGGGLGGSGAHWNGGCDGNKGGSASSTPGANGQAGINGAYADPRDEILLGGGAKGGASAGYLGRAGTGGGAGGNGTYVKKWFKINGPGAPVPGTTWYMWIGYNNAQGVTGSWNRGQGGWCYISWT